MGNCLGTIGGYRDTIGHSVTQCCFIIFTSKNCHLVIIVIGRLRTHFITSKPRSLSSQCFALERGGAAALSVSLIPFGRLSILLPAVVAPWGATPELAVLAHFLGTVIGLRWRLVWWRG